MCELRELYRKAYRKWGIKTQLLMVIEEMAELTKAICKVDRNGLLFEQNKIVNEFVDVKIMMEQLELILSDHLHSYESMYKNIRKEKLEYLERLINLNQ